MRRNNRGDVPKMQEKEIKDYVQKLCTVTFKGALQEMMKVMVEGLSKYPEDDWEDRPAIHHIQHIIAHLNNYRINPCYENLEDLTHAMTRCTMLVQSQLNKQAKNDNIRNT